MELAGLRSGLTALALSLQDEVKHSKVRLETWARAQSREMTENPGPISLILASPDSRVLLLTFH